MLAVGTYVTNVGSTMDNDKLISKLNALAHYNRDKMWGMRNSSPKLAAVYLGKWTAFEQAVKEIQAMECDCGDDCKNGSVNQ